MTTPYQHHAWQVMPVEPPPVLTARPAGDLEPTRLGNPVAQPGGRFTPPDGRLEQEVLEEIADGTRLANISEANRMARELRYWRSSKGAA